MQVLRLSNSVVPHTASCPWCVLFVAGETTPFMIVSEVKNLDQVVHSVSENVAKFVVMLRNNSEIRQFWVLARSACDVCLGNNPRPLPEGSPAVLPRPAGEGGFLACSGLGDR